jgi:hypothetical protein
MAKMTGDFCLDQASMEIIGNTIGVSSIDEIADRDYHDFAPRNEDEREIAERFRSLNRGSVRYILRKFYTQEELHSAKSKADEFSLP